MSERSQVVAADEPMQAREVLRAEDLHKRFSDGATQVTVLSGASVVVHEGERLAIVGRSGSGKSTLLHILAGLDDPDSGGVWVAGENLTGANARARARIRNQHMGFVYQFHHLLPEFSARENVAMPRLLGGAERRAAEAHAAELLERVGLGARLDHRPHQLSGGERQRVAVARALAPNPAIVLADEPTGNLDTENAEQVAALMNELSVELATAFVVVTHDPQIAGWADRVLTLDHGVLDG